MTVDTQKLREAIARMKADGIDGWFDLSDELYEDSVGDGFSPLPETDFRYIVEASPATVSALLDEIDRLNARCDGRGEQIDRLTERDKKRGSLIQRQGAEITRLMAEIDRLRAELQARQWQPIETAPKDGRTLLLAYFNSLGKWRTVRGQWMSEDYIAEHWDDPNDVEPGWFETSVEADDAPNCWRIKPTHWQHLPPAPPQGEKEC